MDFKSLSQIDITDLKNLKFSDVRSRLQSGSLVGLKFVLVAVAAIALFFGFSNGMSRKKSLITELSDDQRKLEVVENYVKTKSDYDAFFKSLPRSIDRDAMIREISQMAESHNIQIVSFFPGEKKLNDLVKANTLELNVIAGSYEELTEFIRALEKSLYLLRLERWSGRMIEVASGPQSEVKQVIEARLEAAGLVIDQTQPAK